MYLAGFSMLCTVAVLSMHHRRRNPAPRILRRVVHDVIGRMLCMNDGNCKVIPQSYDRDRLTWLMVLPRDAVLVRYLLLRVSVSSVRASVRLYRIKTTGPIKLVFGMEAFFHLSYTKL